jgi:hypothetical protein
VVGGADDNPGDLHLQPISPCIDAGSNAALPPDTLDLDGDGNTDEPLPIDLDGAPRISGRTVDMGVYELPITQLLLDIRPQDCPNTFTVNLKSKGRLPMAILGTDAFDVTRIDVNTLSIDGLAFPVKTPSIEDETSPAAGGQCACHIGKPDGFYDLKIHFSIHDVIMALGLDAMPAGETVPITVQGALLDGTPFEATDCVTLLQR